VSLGWRPSSVRLRLALWYSAAVALVLVIYAAGVYVFVRNSLRTELDRALHDDLEIVEQLLDANASGTGRWPEAKGHHDAEGETVRWMEVWSPPGNLTFRSPGMAELPAPASVPTKYDYTSVSTSVGTRVRTLTAAHTVGSSEFVVRVARSEERVAHELNELLLGLGLGLPIAMICAGIGGYHLAKRTLKPVESMTEQARSITADQLRTRMPVENPNDELGHLATVFNELLGRIEEAFDRLKRFTADASHELRTPLTAIRSVGEVGLREPRDAATYREVIGSMLEEADRLTRLVDSLLFLSRADSAHTRVNRESLQLPDLAREVAGHLLVLAEDRGQSIVVDAGAAVEVEVDHVLVREALVNIIDNAIKYSPAGSTITIRVARMGREALIAVADQGSGVPYEHRERIFHRFFRVDEARTRDRGGVGLGLAIAKWAVEIHGGHISVDERAGGGAEFRIFLPLSGSDARLQDRRS
jgi:heavy metal sensor kinase